MDANRGYLGYGSRHWRPSAWESHSESCTRNPMNGFIKSMVDTPMGHQEWLFAMVKRLKLSGLATKHGMTLFILQETLEGKSKPMWTKKEMAVKQWTGCSIQDLITKAKDRPQWWVLSAAASIPSTPPITGASLVTARLTKEYIKGWSQEVQKEQKCNAQSQAAISPPDHP